MLKLTFMNRRQIYYQLVKFLYIENVFLTNHVQLQESHTMQTEYELASMNTKTVVSSLIVWTHNNKSMTRICVVSIR